MTLRAGLTGGIGAGKTTVALMLAERGAAVVDADVIAREVVAPGTPAYDALAARFGRAVVAGDGTIDRAALAHVVFADPDALADLDAITHPVIEAVMLEQLAAVDGSGMRASAGSARRAGSVGSVGSVGSAGSAGSAGSVAVAVVPLLRPSHVDVLGLDVVVVVDCPTEIAVRRLVEARDMDEADARARIAAQPSREERLVLADYVVDNGSTRSHLVREVDALWAQLTGARQSGEMP